MLDAIVIGAGHNGLTTAATLARAGREVLVVEASAEVGGIARGRALHPGYRTAGLTGDSCLVRPHVIEALQLTRHGLKLRDAPPDVLALGDGGESLRLAGRPEAAAAAIGGRDGERYLEYTALLSRLGNVVRDFFDRPAIDVVDIESESLWQLARRGLAVRKLGKTEMMELLRLPPMCVADVVGEWFHSELLRAALCLPGLEGTFTGPRSPGNALNLLRRAALAGPGVVGGGPMLVDALRRAAEAHGVTIRTGARVQSIALRGDGAAGVVLQDGERIEARTVAASCDPRTTLLQLVPPGAIPVRLEHHARTFRARGSVAFISWAVRGEVELGGQRIEHARTGARVDDLERAYDAIKYGETSEVPVLELHVPTVADPSLAPAGDSVVSASCFFAPHEHARGWTEQTRAELADRAQAVLARHVPDLADRIVARDVLAPPDLAAEYHLPGGHHFHGEHSLDQLLVRPTPACIHYRTPIPNLYMCGSGTHPGGGLTCGPGHLAATAILEAR